MATVIIDGIEVIVSDIDRYLQINDINGSDLSKIWEQIKIDYESYEKWICYHNYNEIPFTVLEEIGAVLEDDSIETRLTVRSFSYSEVSAVIRVEDERFDEFAAYHNQCNPENGAKSELIKRNPSHWAVFALLTNNRITDYIVLATGNLAQAEIFCVEASDSAKCEQLIKVAAKHALDIGKKEVLHMVDENSITHKVSLSVGFTITGFYKGYRVKVLEKKAFYDTHKEL
jgi:hypothetical protein